VVVAAGQHPRVRVDAQALRTTEGGDLTISYATAPYGSSQQHTGTQLRIAAGGPQAANVLGVTDQTELFFTMKRALGLR